MKVLRRAVFLGLTPCAANVMAEHVHRVVWDYLSFERNYEIFPLQPENARFALYGTVIMTDVHFRLVSNNSLFFNFSSPISDLNPCFTRNFR
jgi:hypothetical protein